MSEQQLATILSKINGLEQQVAELGKQLKINTKSYLTVALYDSDLDPRKTDSSHPGPRHWTSGDVVDSTRPVAGLGGRVDPSSPGLGIGRSKEQDQIDCSEEHEP